MSEGFGGSPKFRGDLSDHLRKPEEPPDCWRDRVRHSWLLYAIVAVLVAAWVGLTVAAVICGGVIGGALFACATLFVPLAIYVNRVVAG